MSEEEKTEEVPEEPEEPSPSDLIDAASAVAERLDAANKKASELIAIQQKLAVEKTFSGDATAGKQEKTQEQIKQENAEEYLKGTGMKEYAFPNAKTDSSYN